MQMSGLDDGVEFSQRCCIAGRSYYLDRLDEGVFEADLLCWTHILVTRSVHMSVVYVEDRIHC